MDLKETAYVRLWVQWQDTVNTDEPCLEFLDYLSNQHILKSITLWRLYVN